MSNTKPKQLTEAEVKQDQGKTDMTLLPLPGLEATAKVLNFGAKKYLPWSWRDHPTPATIKRYEAAMMRHLLAHNYGEELDEDSGLSHISHIACNALIILSLQAEQAKEKKDG
ncbi:MAG: DUF5664 domain-containing protein [Gammaproteobacteria bacterium]|nr:DUF5664 domain-containing protein [Gammaproteobacteria bacterium]